MSVTHRVCLLLALIALASVAAQQFPVRVIQSARDTGDRLTEKAPIYFSTSHVVAPNTIKVYSDNLFQEIFGFGGAFTEASAYVLSLLPENVQQQVMDLYFGPGGNNYTVGRIHMNSCDFSLASYSYDDVVGDYGLTNFNTSHDELYLLPMLRRAAATTKNVLRFYISPWSPPAWMKSNGQMDSSFAPGMIDDKRVHASWALFYSKYITDLKSKGFDIWGLTIQNEPENNATWESCLYTPQQQADFIRDFLGPQIRNDHPDVKIMIFDHNKDDIVTYAKGVLSDPAAAQYVDGTAFHWYAPLPYFSHVQQVHDIDPNKFVFATEACNCPGVRLDDWSRGELYGFDIIGDLEAWSIGWMDWNLLLNAEGGPNHVHNYCDAALIADTDAGTLHIQPPYYYMGHFSRFLPPGSRRAAQHTTLHSTVFVTPDQQVVVTVQNMGETAAEFRLVDGVYEVASTVPAHGIQTLIYPRIAA